MKNLIEYRPLLEIVLYDGKSEFIPADQKAVLKNSINSQKFVEINEILVNTNDIRRIVPFVGDIEWSKGLSPELASRIKERIKRYKASLQREPSRKVIYEWIGKVKKGESI